MGQRAAAVGPGDRQAARTSVANNTRLHCSFVRACAASILHSTAEPGAIISSLGPVSCSPLFLRRWRHHRGSGLILTLSCAIHICLNHRLPLALLPFVGRTQLTQDPLTTPRDANLRETPPFFESSSLHLSRACLGQLLVFIKRFKTGCILSPAPPLRVPSESLPLPIALSFPPHRATLPPRGPAARRQSGTAPSHETHVRNPTQRLPSPVSRAQCSSKSAGGMQPSRWHAAMQLAAWCACVMRTFSC